MRNQKQKNSLLSHAFLSVLCLTALINVIAASSAQAENLRLIHANDTLGQLKTQG